MIFLHIRSMAIMTTNRKLISEQFQIHKPQIIAHSDTAMDLKSLKLFHEVLAFNHRAEPNKHVYRIAYETICKTKDQRNIQKLISQEVERISTRMQAFIFKVDKKKMQEITGERNSGSISPFDRIVYEGSHIKVVLGNSFKKLLVQFQQFYVGDARTVRKLNHKASIHMYWLILSISWRSNSFTMEVEEFKKYLGCEGQYVGRWDNFKKYVLDPMVKEFKGTWAEFTYDTIRKGRKIAKIKIAFQDDAQVIRQLINESPFKFEHQLHLFGMEMNQIYYIRERVLKKDYTEQDVERVVSFVEKNRKIKNKAGYIIKALKEGWYKNIGLQIELPMPAHTPQTLANTQAELPGKKYSADVEHVELSMQEKNHKIMVKFGISSEAASSYMQSIPEDKLYRILYTYDCIPMSIESPQLYKDDLIATLDSKVSS